MMFTVEQVRPLTVENKWVVHSYYSLNPYAPDGSGRILCAGGDYTTDVGEVFVLDKDGKVLDRFGKQKVSAIFYHTGLWQAWGKDAETVYYQAADGDVLHPHVRAHDLKTGKETDVQADMEGAPIYGEPLLYGLSGIYYASGYGDGRYHPEQSPVPFGARDEHGLFLCKPSTGEKRLALSVNDVLAIHPRREELLAEDKKCFARTGTKSTLMIYCARYNREGSRIMFHFGNHCTDKRRGEPHLLSLFTAKVGADGTLSDLRHALDLNYENTGVHWSWMNRDTLIGYAKTEKTEWKTALCAVKADGSDFRVLSRNFPSGGHPSVCPFDESIAVTDTWDTEDRSFGKILFIDTKTDTLIQEYRFPRANRKEGPIPSGRNRFYVCHHPVFNADGTRMLFNTLPDRNAQLCEMIIGK